MYSVRCGVTLKSSCTNASCCHVQTSGVMSVEGCVNVVTFPNRKFAHDCWKVLVPVGAPTLVNVKVPCGVPGLFSVLLYRFMTNPNLKVWRPLIQFRLSKIVQV